MQTTVEEARALDANNANGNSGAKKSETQRSEPGQVRHDWTLDEVTALYNLPFFELLDRARAVHRAVHHAIHGGDAVQALHPAQRQDGRLPGRLLLLAPSPSHYETEVGPEKMLDAPRSRRRAARATTARPGSAWAPPGAR